MGKFDEMVKRETELAIETVNASATDCWFCGGLRRIDGKGHVCPPPNKTLTGLRGFLDG